MRRFALLGLVLACAPAVPDAGATDADVPDQVTAGAPGAEPEGALSLRERAAPPPSLPQSVEPVRGRYDLERPVRRFELPGRLDEISGLAFTDDGRLFAHDDEQARVHQLDPVTGEVGKRFDLGGGPVQGDFEDITIVGDRFFLVTSIGFLYEFREGADRQDIGYRVTDLGVRDSCEVEGLDHDPIDDVLLIACKASTPDHGEIMVHRVPVDPGRGALAPLRIPRAGLVAHGLEPEFEASAVVVHPSGTLLLVAGPQEVLLEVDRAGTILDAVELDRARHPQPEGLEIGPDGTLYVSDERNGPDAHLTAYGPAEPTGPA